MFKVSVPKKEERVLKKIPEPWRKRIVLTLKELEKNPFLGAKMWGQLEGKRKIRVWPYRIIYSLDQERKIVSILEIGHRGNLRSYR